MNDFFSEHFIFIIVGVVSALYGCSWIYRILNKTKPFHKRQYVYIALALFMILCGVSTFFTKCILNCLCGTYAGFLEITNLYHEYTESKKNKNDINIYYYLDGLCLGLTFILFSLNFIMNIFFE